MAIQLSDKSLEELEKERSAYDLIPKNTICDFEVKRDVAFGTSVHCTEDTTSKNTGNEMIKVVLEVFHDGKPTTIIDYLMGGKMEWKLKQFMAAIGAAGEEATAENFIGKTGKAKVGIQVDKTGQYSDKNNIVEYVATPQAVEVDLDDEIPFA